MSSITLDEKGLVVRCPKCSQRNRLHYAQLDKSARCPQCQEILGPPREPVEIGQESSFAALVNHSSLPLLVDFWAAWCGPCKMVAPELVKVAAENSGRLLVVKVNTDTFPEIARQSKITSLPTLALIKQRRELGRTLGARPARQIQEFIQQFRGA